MKTMLIAAAGLLAMTGGATNQKPSPERMAAAAYRMPIGEVQATIAAMRRHLMVSEEDTADALGHVAACSRTGGMSFRGVSDGIRAIAPVWDGGIRHRRLDAAWNIAPDGIGDLDRICGALEIARRAHGDTPTTIISVRDAIAGNAEASRVAKALIASLPTMDVDGSRVLDSDYRERLLD